MEFCLPFWICAFETSFYIQWVLSQQRSSASSPKTSFEKGFSNSSRHLVWYTPWQPWHPKHKRSNKSAPKCSKQWQVARSISKRPHFALIEVASATSVQCSKDLVDELNSFIGNALCLANQKQSAVVYSDRKLNMLSLQGEGGWTQFL